MIDLGFSGLVLCPKAKGNSLPKSDSFLWINTLSFVVFRIKRCPLEAPNPLRPQSSSGKISIINLTQRHICNLYTFAAGTQTYQLPFFDWFLVVPYVGLISIKFLIRRCCTAFQTSILDKHYSPCSVTVRAAPVFLVVHTCECSSLVTSQEGAFRTPLTCPLD